MNTLENQLETAFSALLRAYEPTLAEIPVRLTTLILAQPADPDAESGGTQASEGNEQLRPPYVLLTAKRGEESLPHSGIFETELTIEAADNAGSASEDGGRLDAMFRAACHPLFFKRVEDPAMDPPFTGTLFDRMSLFVENFSVLGMPRRADGTEMENAGSIVKRTMTAAFLCRSTEPDFHPYGQN